MVRDRQVGCRLLMLHLRARMTRRRWRVLMATTTLSGIIAGIGAYLIPWPPELDRVETAVLAFTLFLGVGSTAALICLTVFARVPRLGWGPSGLLTPESLHEIHRARRERRLPVLSDAQQEFVIAQSRHTRLALPWTIVLALIFVPLTSTLIVSTVAFGPAPSTWTTLGLLLLYSGTGASNLALLGRTAAFVPLDEPAGRELDASTST